VSDDYRAHLRRRLTESGVPEQLHDGLTEYIAARRPMGHFLTAVVSNDLREACARADDVCRDRLHTIVFFLFNYANGQCWGSPQLVSAWLTDESTPPEIFE